MSIGAPRAVDQPVYFGERGAELFGMLTSPAGPGNGVVVVALAGGAWTPGSHRNGMWARLARRLAASGYHTFRIDYRGVGESTGVTSHFDLAEPFAEDVLAACRWLAEHELTEVVVAGTCFGARSALAAADRIEGLRGVAMFSPPIMDNPLPAEVQSRSVRWFIRRAVRADVLRGLRDPAQRRTYLRIARDRLRRRPDVLGREGRTRVRVSPGFREPMEFLMRRSTPVLISYGDDDEDYHDFEAARAAGLDELVDVEHVTVIVSPGVQHSFASIESQERTIDQVADWTARITAPPATPS